MLAIFLFLSGCSAPQTRDFLSQRQPHERQQQLLDVPFYPHSGIDQNYRLGMSRFEHTWRRCGYWGLLATPPEKIPGMTGPLEWSRAALDSEQTDHVLVAFNAYQAACNADPALSSHCSEAVIRPTPCIVLTWRLRIFISCRLSTESRWQQDGTTWLMLLCHFNVYPRRARRRLRHYHWSRITSPYSVRWWSLGDPRVLPILAGQGTVRYGDFV